MALERDRLCHERSGPARLAWLAAALTLGGPWISGAVVGAGLAFLIGASLWSWTLVRGLRSWTAATEEG